MLYGVTQAQEAINNEIKRFIDLLLSPSNKMTLDEFKNLQIDFMSNIQHILIITENPSQLDFDQAIEPTLHDVLSQLKASVAIEGLLTLKDKYKFNYGSTLPKSLSLEEMPDTLFELDDVLKDKRGRQFILKAKLGGRGQSGRANFYEETNTHKQFLVKEDTPDTCLLEGTAYFVKNAKLVPQALSNAINFASVATLMDKDKHNQTVSVQERVSSPDDKGKVCPWDEIVYSVKRNPKTIWSFESWYPEYVKRAVAELNSKAQWDLAAALLLSNIAGDESLHVGQFMAMLDKDNHVVGIKRIDMGARERFALERSAKEQVSPYHASLSYQGSIWKGQQNGKDYISYLLAEKGLKRKYTLLWLQLAKRFNDNKVLFQKEIMDNSFNAFVKQYDAIPEEHKDKVLETVLATLNKSSKTPLTFVDGANRTEKLKFLAKNLAELDYQRAEKMIDLAQKESVTDLKQFELDYKAKIESKHQHVLTQTLMHRDNILNKNEIKEVEIVSFTGELNTLIEESLKMALSNPKNKLSYEQVQLYAQAALEVLEAQQLAIMDSPNKGKEQAYLEAQIKKYNTLSQVSAYCIATSSKDKLPLMINVMQEAMKLSENDFAKKLMLNNQLITKLCEQSGTLSYVLDSYVKTQRSNGYYLLHNLFERYGIDKSYLTLTSAQVMLKDQILAKNFKNVYNTVSQSSFDIKDILAPNEDGVTGWHLLLQQANNDDAFEAIVKVMLKSRGTTSNSDLAIKDGNEKEALDYLADNPAAKELLAYLKKAKYEIKGGWLGNYTYQLSDFFNMTKFSEVENTISEQNKQKGLRAI